MSSSGPVGSYVVAVPQGKVAWAVNALTSGLSQNQLMKLKVRSGEHLAAILTTAFVDVAPTNIDSAGGTDLQFDFTETRDNIARIFFGDALAAAFEVKSTVGGYREFEAAIDRCLQRGNEPGEKLFTLQVSSANTILEENIRSNPACKGTAATQDGLDDIQERLSRGAPFGSIRHRVRRGPRVYRPSFKTARRRRRPRQRMGTLGSWLFDCVVCSPQRMGKSVVHHVRRESTTSARRQSSSSAAARRDEVSRPHRTKRRLALCVRDSTYVGAPRLHEQPARRADRLTAPAHSGPLVDGL